MYRSLKRILSTKFVLVVVLITAVYLLAYDCSFFSSTRYCFYETTTLKKHKNVRKELLVFNNTIKPINNRVDFKFVFPDITPDISSVHDIFLIVFVNSAAKGHRDRRNTICKTWGSHRTCEQQKAMEKHNVKKNLKWLLVFVLGKTGTPEDVANAREAKEYNDMLIGDIVDNYVNNIIKLYMGLLWSSSWAPRYILKADDDVYVRIPNLIEHLVEHGLPKRYYGGKTFINYHVVHRGK